MFIVSRKLSRLVSTNWPRSSFLSEKPIAWTRKSIVSQRAFSVVERRVEVGHVGDVAIDQEVGAQLLGERAHPLLQRLALIGESELGALRRAAPWRSPGERAVVGEAHDQAALALPSSRSLLPPVRSPPTAFATGLLLRLVGGFLVDHRLDILLGSASASPQAPR